jgi:hypothetical protein
VTGGKLADLAVIAGKIAAGAVNSAAIADGTVDTADLRDGAVAAAKLAPGAVDSAAVLDHSLTANDLGAAGSFTLSPGTLEIGECKDLEVDLAEVAQGDRVVLTAPRGLEPGLFAMPLTPDVNGKLPLRLCNLSGAQVNAGPLTWRYLAIG